ncbi:sialidase family protein [Lactobacillus crispatus]|uniref:Glycosyl hydrolase n=1 Tax=Lactobacillus crispatus TaxID=47770 RepID=A0A7H9E7C5_9LACO|nr:exo-alpha-sialidase [Lactobacillus crispatus]QLL73526.1 glycosyl hydrolase [Lactobacillus crispatus]
MVLQDSLTDTFDKAMLLPDSGIQSHASNLLMLENGDILCTWFSGTEEGKSDITIFLSRMKKETAKWTIPEAMSNNPGRSDQNPVLFKAPNGDLWLLYTSQQGGNQDTAIIQYRISHDLGKTWTRQKELFPGETGLFIRHPLVVSDSGEWILPLYHCVIKNDGKPWDGSFDYSAVRVSSDEGNTWKEYEIPNSKGCVQMSIVKLSQGRGFVGLFRSRWADHIYRTSSQDGKKWTVPAPIALPNNNSSIQASLLADGNIVMAFNKSSKKDAKVRRLSLFSDETEEKDAPDESHGKVAFWGAPRAPMTVALSENDGKTWPYIRNVAEGSGYALTNNSKDKKNREFSYPSIKQNLDGQIDLTFTYFRQNIAFVELSEDWIKKGEN